MQRQEYRQLLFLVVALLFSTAGFAQSAVKGQCVSATIPAGIGGASALTLNTTKCPPVKDPNANQMIAPDITFPVYADINARVDALDTKIDKLSSDAIKVIKDTMDGQALKADDVARVVQATRDDILKQLQNDLKKAVQDAISDAVKKQIATEVAKQLADKEKQPK
jgi:hypothetical protein